MATTIPGGTTTRRAFALGLGALLAARLAPGADAKPKGKLPPIKARVQNLVDLCGAVGGTASTDVRPGGTSVSCSGGEGPVGESTCVVTSKGVRCYHHRS
jgi:hypothetical protein